MKVIIDLWYTACFVYYVDQGFLTDCTPGRGGRVGGPAGPLEWVSHRRQGFGHFGGFFDTKRKNGPKIDSLKVGPSPPGARGAPELLFNLENPPGGLGLDPPEGTTPVPKPMPRPEDGVWAQHEAQDNFFGKCPSTAHYFRGPALFFSHFLSR